MGRTHTNPAWTTFLPQCIGFLIVLTIFKVAGLALSKKAALHFKYNTGEVQQIMWHRLDHRLGLCLGFFNGAAFFGTALAIGLVLLPARPGAVVAVAALTTVVEAVSPRGLDNVAVPLAAAAALAVVTA